MNAAKKIPQTLLAYLLCCIGTELSGQSAVGKQPVTVADTVTMTLPGDRSYLNTYEPTGELVKYSPDRRRFAFVTQKGNLEKNTVEYALFVFNTADVFSGRAPQSIVSMASSSNGEAISQLTWLADNTRILFVGENPGERPQLYAINTKTRKLQKLTNHPNGVVEYASDPQGRRILCVAKPTLPPVMTDDMLEGGFFVTTQDWTQIYTNKHYPWDTRRELFITSIKDGISTRVGGVIDLFPEPNAIPNVTVSPDGRFAIVRSYVVNPPKSWFVYRHESLRDLLDSPLCRSGNGGYCPEQFLLADLERRTLEPLIDAPILGWYKGSRTVYGWSADGSSILLLNTFLPAEKLNTAPSEELFFAAEITLPARDVKVISKASEPYKIESVYWDQSEHQFVAVAVPGSDLRSLLFRRNRDEWHISKMTKLPAAEARLSVKLEEDMNSPPQLVAIDSGKNKKALLLDLNPQFRDLSFGRVELFNWKAVDGHEVVGTLYYPPDYTPGRRYPLIIQTHGFSTHRFWIDGPFTTAFAAQPLANQGFVVLQTNMGVVTAAKEIYAAFDSPREAPRELASYEGAIQELALRGIIDRERVGLIGFSRTVYHVLYALAHSKYKFGAAVIADGANFGYLNCLLFLPKQLCERVNEGPPFGATLLNWIKNVPTFNLDKVDAPLLLQSIQGPLGEFEVYSGLRWLNKPAELLNFYPEGDHVLVRPRQRLASQQATVDWFRFWLKGEEDPQRQKAQLYHRWREMQIKQESRGR